MKAVIFDFDYTLGDSSMGIALSINYALENMGYSAKDTENIKRTIGLSLKETFSALTSNNNLEDAEQFSKLFKEKADVVMVDNTVLYHEVKDVLKNLRLRGYKTSIVTTKFHYRIEQILKKFDAVDLIDVIVGAEDVKVEKPNPEGLLFAINQLKINKQEVLYVGDSIVDAMTAESAGVNFAAVLTGTTDIGEFKKYSNVHIGENISSIYDYILHG